MSDDGLLQDVFRLSVDRRGIYDVTMTSKGLKCGRKGVHGEFQQVPLFIDAADITGCVVSKKTKGGNPGSSNSFTVISYPLKTNGCCCCQKPCRKRAEVTFDPAYAVGDDELSRICHRWMRAIQRIALGQAPGDAGSKNKNSKRSFLFLINPKGGQGHGMKYFRKYVQPVIEEAEIEHHIITTEHAGHATEIMRDLDVNKYDAVVIVSGDGLICEVIQGIMTRTDHKDALRIPIGVIPAGSGNALSWTINYQKGEPLGVELLLHAVFVLIKTTVTPLDLIRITTPDRTLYSFLSLSWGFIADVDYESERYRWMGGARFTFYSLIRIARLRKYSGTIYYLPKRRTICSNSSRAMSVNSPSDVLLSSTDRKHSSVTNGFLNQSFTNDEGSSGPSLSQNSKTSSSSMHSNVDAKEEELILEMPPLSESLPDHWVKRSGYFVTVIAVYLPFIGGDTLISPKSKLNDRTIFLQIIKEGVTKTALLKILLDIETGKHLESPFVECIEVQGFRIVPDSDRGNIMVDGERVPVTPVQGCLHPEHANILGL